MSDGPKAKRARNAIGKKDCAVPTTGSDDKVNSNPLGFTLNGYKGYKLKEDDKIDKLLWEEKIGPQYFFENYVSKRKPCIIDKFIDAEDWQKNRFDVRTLTDLAGDEMVQVERRYDSSESFGQQRTKGRQVDLTLKSFINELRLGNENLYMTTQEYDSEYRMYGTPCCQLLEAGRIEAKPTLAGNLILQSCNMWLGRSKHGSSSGLHHDYHDNLYILIQGKKKVRLFSPDQAEYLATNGTIDRVYFNGRVSYMGSETLADGRPSTMDDMSANNESVQNDDVVIGKGFDYVSSDEEEGNINWNDAKRDDFECELNGEIGDDCSNKCGEEGSDEVTHTDEGFQPIDSFSRINLENVSLNEFPLFVNTKHVEVDVESGQMLYLPCGWFHEVRSYSNSIPLGTKTVEKKLDTSFQDAHMALNYWFHPPNNLNDWTQPYNSTFWQDNVKKQTEGKYST